MTNKELNIKCYDNGGRSFDRYTVVYLDYFDGKVYEAVGMSANPFHPQGFGQHCTARLGRHLGRAVEFEILPEDCKKLVYRDLGRSPTGEIDLTKQN